MVQEYTSKNTSINKTKVPALFSTVDKHIGWNPHTINFDIGGGKYDTAKDYLSKRRVRCFIYDKYNRSEPNNRSILKVLSLKKADTATISNVLNVIREKEVRQEVLRLAYDYVKQGGVIFISVYNSGKEGESKPDCWQNAMGIHEYLEEVREVFPTATIMYGIIVAPRD